MYTFVNIYNLFMIERLQEIMSYYQLTPSALADSLEIPRSSISHLLTGRNKPSLDFVIRLIRKYPEIDLYWFLNGKGTFPKEKILEKKSTTETPTLAKQPSIIKKEEKDLTSKIKSTQTVKNKKVKQIVFFYEDGSFETYLPN